MGARGPLPVPHARRRNKRQTSGHAIQVSRPTKPRGRLSKEAQAEWDRIVPELEAMGTLASIDRSVLIRYCTAWGEWCEINEQLNDTGRLVRSQNRTGLVRNPLWFLRSDVEAVLVDLGKQLALSPTSRLRVGIEHQQPEVEEAPKVTAFDKYRQRLGA